MGYIVAPYLVSIDDLKNSLGSKDQNLIAAVLEKKKNDKVLEALVNGDLLNREIGSLYGYALEQLCKHFGKREFIEALEDVHYSDEFDEGWPWLFAKKPLVPFAGWGTDFPFIGYLSHANISKELKRTQKLKFEKLIPKSADSQQENENYKNQMRLECEIYSADYETATVSPADFPWLDESYYDSVQQELEKLGFNKVRDKELLPFSRVSPKTRHFVRVLINAKRNIIASISQIRFVSPTCKAEKSVDIKIVKFSSELSDGRFLETNNTESVYVLENIDGVLFWQFPPDASIELLLAGQNGMIEAQTKILVQHTKEKIKLRKHTTDAALESACERQFLLLRADRQKKAQAEVQSAANSRYQELIEWLEKVRSDMLALYEKAIKAKKDIVTFYY